MPSFDDSVAYERRVVAFYDILGWRNKIDAAGDDVARVNRLKAVVRMFASLGAADLAKHNRLSVRQSTFSDNVVISTDAAGASITTLFVSLGMTQLICASMGFLLRGGITIGNIAHDDNIALGPALVRAYDLERLSADKPKIILDEQCLREFGPVEKLTTVLDQEDGVYFLNPWRLSFAQASWYLQSPDARKRTLSPKDLLERVLGHVLIDLQNPADDKTARRLTWLRDRLGPELLKN